MTQIIPEPGSNRQLFAEYIPASLQNLDLWQIEEHDGNSVHLPYLTTAGETYGHRYRTRTGETFTGSKHSWEPGTEHPETFIYGLQQLSSSHPVIVLVEGETAAIAGKELQSAWGWLATPGAYVRPVGEHWTALGDYLADHPETRLYLWPDLDGPGENWTQTVGWWAQQNHANPEKLESVFQDARDYLQWSNQAQTQKLLQAPQIPNPTPLPNYPMPDHLRPKPNVDRKDTAGITNDGTAQLTATGPGKDQRLLEARQKVNIPKCLETLGAVHDTGPKWRCFNTDGHDGKLERTGSLHIYPNRTYFCHGGNCRISGDALDLFQAAYGKTLKETLEILMPEPPNPDSPPAEHRNGSLWMVPATEWDKLPPPPPGVEIPERDGLILHPGAPTFVLGRPKTGKTSICWDWMLQLAEAGYKVGGVELEGHAQVRTRLEATLQTRPKLKDKIFIPAIEMVRLTPATLHELQNWIADENITGLIISPWSYLLQEENSANAQQDVKLAIDEILKTGIILVTQIQERKAPGVSGMRNAFEVARGSIEISAIAGLTYQIQNPPNSVNILATAELARNMDISAYPQLNYQHTGPEIARYVASGGTPGNEVPTLPPGTWTVKEAQDYWGLDGGNGWKQTSTRLWGLVEKGLVRAIPKTKGQGHDFHVPEPQMSIQIPVENPVHNPVEKRGRDDDF